MKTNFDQSSYWNRVAPQKRFTHILNTAWLAGIVQKDDPILDYGCGQGRLVKQLRDLGYTNLMGMDSAEEMLEVGRKEEGLENLIYNNSPQIPLPDHSQKLIILFAVLTCIPFSEDQQALIDEIRRVLTPDGRIYISDPLINDDKRNLDRYTIGKEKYGTYGIFELPEGVVCRHHDRTYLTEKLLHAFDIESEESFVGITMNGNPTKSIQNYR